MNHENKTQLIDYLIEQIKKDIQEGDTNCLSNLFWNINDLKRYLEYLPEETQEMLKNEWMHKEH